MGKNQTTGNQLYSEMSVDTWKYTSA